MKTDNKLIKTHSFSPMGFGWYTGSKSSVKKPVNLSIKHTNEDHEF